MLREVNATTSAVDNEQKKRLTKKAETKGQNLRR